MQWINEADVDGFNMAYISNPGSFEDIVELLIPELRKRGLLFEDYAVPGGTFRENLLRQPGQKTLRDDHYGSQFTFEREVSGRKTPKRKADVEPNITPSKKVKHRYGTRTSVRVT
jgi:hypothetical protein